MIATILTPAIMELGGGAIAGAASVLHRLGVRRPLVVTDPWMRDSGTVERLLAPLRDAGFQPGLFADTVPDPTVTVVEQGAALLREGGYDGMLALGGGSPIDTAKAMGVLAANGGAMRDYKVPNPIPLAGPPLVAIPTTAGTGSEVTRFTVITDAATDEKMLIASPLLVPSAAIIDYELTLSCPPRLTADTGIDALTHAIEAYVSAKANPFSDSMALAAMGRIAPYIRTAVAEPGNRVAREAMMLGATLAGMAFSNASVALVHGMSRPIGAFFHVPHGLSNAMLLPAVTHWSLPGAPARYADCARAIGAADVADSDDVAGEKLVAALRDLNTDLKVPSPKTYGIDPARWNGLLETMAAQALASGSPANNPRVPDVATMVALYRESWG
ncbi:iron-containing alcohol dehydrogenase [Niveispirillum sp. BGYR6]|uniref:iron-containing alcohol dehydrogenase n=1 Tax=Niveispirillum sp. BGYR6 TaxID=2971249 RepID=UPI0022B98CFC|nr:iron-containing alcohol dehydrogenase [Niveispirillum sp. BGYR6]MDG5495453.1 iron-containing alcohol dehydrogenase [Niveispirillum sp. BGYR6]